MEMDKEQLAVEIARLEDENGIVTPDRFVERAEPEDHPLHPLLLWDNTKAGHRYRLAQARALIRSVRVEYLHNEVTTYVVKYVHAPTEEKTQNYQSVLILRNDADMARKTALLELAYARAAVERARSVAQALEYDELFEALMTSLQRLRERVETEEAHDG